MIKWSEVNWRKLLLGGGIGVFGLLSYTMKKYYYDEYSHSLEQYDEDFDREIDWVDMSKQLIGIGNVSYELIVNRDQLGVKVCFDIDKTNDTQKDLIITITPLMKDNQLISYQSYYIVNGVRFNCKYRNSRQMITIGKGLLLKGGNQLTFPLQPFNNSISLPFIYNGLLSKDQMNEVSFIIDPNSFPSQFLPHELNTIEAKIAIPHINYLYLSFNNYSYSHHSSATLNESKSSITFYLHSNQPITNSEHKLALAHSSLAFISKYLTVSYPFESFHIIFTDNGEQVLSLYYGIAVITAELLEGERNSLSDAVYINFLIVNGVISSFLLSFLPLKTNKDVVLYHAIALFLSIEFFNNNSGVYPNETLFVEELKGKVIDFSEGEESMAIEDAFDLKERNEISSFKLGLVLLYLSSVKSTRSELLQSLVDCLMNRTSFDYFNRKELEVYLNSTSIPMITIDIQSNSTLDYKEEEEKGEVLVINQSTRDNKQHEIYFTIGFYYGLCDFIHISNNNSLSIREKSNNIKLLSSNTMSKPLSECKIIIFDDQNAFYALQEYSLKEIAFLKEALFANEKFGFTNRQLLVLNRNLHHMVKRSQLDPQAFISITHNLLMNSHEKPSDYVAGILINHMVHISLEFAHSYEQKTVVIDYLINCYLASFPLISNLIVNCLLDLIDSNSQLSLAMNKIDCRFYSSHRRKGYSRLWVMDNDFASKNKEKLLAKLKGDYNSLVLSKAFQLTSKLFKQIDAHSSFSQLKKHKKRIEDLIATVYSSPTTLSSNQVLLYFLISDSKKVMKRIENEHKLNKLYLYKAFKP